MINKTIKKAVILANGREPDKELLTYFLDKGFHLICADGGANTARALNLCPEVVVGDFDSITPENFDFFSRTSKMINRTSQEDTDVEKCLNYCLENSYIQVYILGATGDRLDHTICNLSILLKYFGKIEILFISEKSLLKVYSGIVEINTVVGEIISLFAFSEKTRIKTEGLKYPLNFETVTFGKRESASNEAVSSLVKLNINDGEAFIIRNLNIMIENGFI